MRWELLLQPLHANGWARKYCLHLREFHLTQLQFKWSSSLPESHILEFWCLLSISRLLLPRATVRNSPLRSHSGAGWEGGQREISERQLFYVTYSNAGQGSNICRNGSVLYRSLIKYWVIWDSGGKTVSSSCVIKEFYWTYIFTEHILRVSHVVVLSAGRRTLQSGYQM